jgi:hypothetical protein
MGRAWRMLTRFTVTGDGIMRTALVLLLAFCSCAARAAPEVDCQSLAEELRGDESALMSLSALGRLRRCVDSTTWAPKSPVPSASSGASGSAPYTRRATAIFRLPQKPDCLPLEDTLATKGPASMPASDRSRLTRCIDDAITTISSQPRPGNSANMPGAKKRPGEIA